MLGYLNWQRKRRFIHRLDVADAIVSDLKRQAPDHIAVTGDLVNLGLPQEYRAARAWLRGLGTPDKVSVIPGNHDIYCRVEPPDDCLCLWSDYMQPDALGRALGDDGAGQSAEMFPYVRQLGPVALVGVNSAVPTPPFVARGRVGDRQRDILRQRLHSIAGKDLFACVMVHHPPMPGLTARSRELSDAAQLIELFGEAPVGLVIYGHNHRDDVAWVENRSVNGGTVAVCGAASASAGRRYKDEPRARYYLYEFEGAGRDLTVTRMTRGLDETSASVIELGRDQVVRGSLVSADVFKHSGVHQKN